MLTPSLEQVKQLAKQYNTIPVFYDFSAKEESICLHHHWNK